MVKIKKGNCIRVVPRSVYENFYKQQGWLAKGETSTNENLVEAGVNSDSDNSEEYEQDEPEEQIDFNSMSNSELKKFAEENQIDISEASSKKQVISILENAMSI